MGAQYAVAVAETLLLVVKTSKGTRRNVQYLLLNRDQMQKSKSFFCKVSCLKCLFFFLPFFSRNVRIRRNQSHLRLPLAAKRTLADLLTMFESIIQCEKVTPDRSHANDICPDWYGLTRSYTWRRDAFRLIFNGKRLSLAWRPSLLQKNLKCGGEGRRTRGRRRLFFSGCEAPFCGELYANT